MKEKILDLLRTDNDYRSGEEISTLLGVSRSAVWKSIQQLRKEGYRIEAVTNRGYCLKEEADVFSEQDIAAALAQFGLTDWIRQVYYAEEVDSTNRMARLKAGQGAPDRSLFITANQQAGRGRMGRSWYAEPDQNLTFSLLFRPTVDPQALAPVTLYAGLCAVMALNHHLTKQNCFGNAGKRATDHPLEARLQNKTHNQVFRSPTNPVPIGIKWPNDLVWKGSGKKLGGILTETILEENRVDALIVGIGINLNNQIFPEEIQSSATSLSLETGRRHRRLAVLGQILTTFRQFESRLADRDRWMPLYRELCLTLNRPVQILAADRQEASGLAVDIDTNGELIIIDSTGERTTVRSGEVSVRGLLGYV